MNETRRTFHQQLADVREGILALGGAVIEMIPRCTDVLLSGDLAAADALIVGDDAIDARSIELEERCYALLLLQQPMAKDLRAVVAALKMIGEIERSADLVVNICKAARRLYPTELDPKLRGLISRMGEQAHQLFRLAIDAYAKEDSPLAAALEDIDDSLDRLQAEFVQAIFEAHAGDRIDVRIAVQLAVVARFYERIGDHAVNLGERVRYMVTGWLPEHTGAARFGLVHGSGDEGTSHAGPEAHGEP